MPKKKTAITTVESKRSRGAYVLLGLFAATLFVIVALSALALKFFAPAPTVVPEMVQRAADSTLDIIVPIYVDETVHALVPGMVSGTLTAIVPTQTPTPTLPPIPCDLAGFVSDGTIPDGTRLSASSAFTKVWLVRNIGTCSWNSDYTLVFSAGELMAGQSPLTIGKVLPPGDTIELAVNLVAPATAGIYTSGWMLANNTGETFGLAPDGQPLTLRIVVGSQVTTALDFTDKACSASWSSAIGNINCPNPDDFVTGAVNPVESISVEGGIEFNLPSLEVIPNEGANGITSGKYSLLQIQKNDTFQAIIGCGNDQPDCGLVFELKYDSGDHNLISLGRWNEDTNNSLQKVSVDLTPLENKTVSLILVVSSASSTSRDNKGVWISPVILRTIK
jgi:hypothetical protein